MSTKLSKQLQIAGLSENEATIYIALLEIGVANVSQIAECSGVIRASAYPILESLENKGLIEKSNHLTSVTYQANPLTKYRELMRSNVDRYRRLRREVEDSVPALRKQFTSAKVRPKILYFSGKSGMKRACNMIFVSREKYIRVVSNAENIFMTLPGYLPQFIFSRWQMNIKMAGIHPDTALTKTLRALPAAAGDKITSLKSNNFKFNIDIAIWDDHVSYMSHKSLYAISVVSLDFAETLKKVYDLSWKFAHRNESDASIHSI